jgi:hypothetical protein
VKGWPDAHSIVAWQVRVIRSTPWARPVRWWLLDLPGQRQ